MTSAGQPLGDIVENWAPPPRPDSARMEGAYAELLPLTDDKAPELFQAYAPDPGMWAYMPYGPFKDQADYADWVVSAARGADPVFIAVADRATNRLVGQASWLRIQPDAGSIEIGHIAFAPGARQSRVATEALVLMIRWAFEAGYRRVEWKCNALNRRSRRAAERLGLSYEGVFRQAAVIKGRNRDTAWFAATDGDWPALSKAYATWLAPENFDGNGLQRRALSDLTHPLLVSRDTV